MSMKVVMTKVGVAERQCSQVHLDLNPSSATFYELQQVSAPMSQFSGLWNGNTNTLQ